MTRHNVWNAPHGPVHVAAHASVREYAPRRAAVRAALFASLLALLFVTPAYADDVPEPSVQWKYQDSYVVSPTSNMFDAALVLIGEVEERSSLTESMRAKLSNESTGGDFYDLAEKFQSVAAAEPPWYSASTSGSFVGQVSGWSTTHLLVQMYGDVNVMWATGITSEMIEDARNDFLTIRNGGNLGGGGGSVEFGNYTLVPLQPWAPEAPIDVQYAAIPKNLYQEASTYAGQNGLQVLCFVGLNVSQANQLYVKMTTLDPEKCTWYVEPSSANFQRPYSLKVSGMTVSSKLRASQVGAAQVQTIDGKNCAVATFTNLVTFSAGQTNVVDGYKNIYYRGWNGGQGAGGSDPVNRWPNDRFTGRPKETEPAILTPPVYDPVTYPDPTDDPLPTPPPETPVTPVNPIVTTDPTNTTPQDYTPWLQAILNELRNFHRDAIGLGNNIVDALLTHCTHITTTIMDETEWLFDQLKAQIRSGVQAILNGLDQNCTEMMDYLEDLAQWLADQLQFTFNIDNSYNPDINVPAYDDGSIIAWLKRIYNAIRNIKGPNIGNPVTDKDVEDGFDWWAWILSLLDQLFDNVISQTVGEVESFLEEFRNLFPLSIPWDVVAILTMWAGTPTTPHFEFTLFEDVAYLPEVTYEIDLSDFDSTAATIRDAEKIVFAFYLLFKTQWLLDTLKSATDAAGEFIEGVITS